MLHKRYQYNIKQLRKILQDNKLMIVKANKSKAIMVINENNLEKKTDNFIQENNKKTIKQKPHQHISKTNPTSTSKMQCTSGQMVT